VCTNVTLFQTIYRKSYRKNPILKRRQLPVLRQGKRASEAGEVAWRDLRNGSRDAGMGGFFQACCQRALVSARHALGACEDDDEAAAEGQDDTDSQAPSPTAED